MRTKKCGVFAGHSGQMKLTDLTLKCDRLQKVFLVHGEPEGINCLAEGLGKAIDTKIRIEKPKNGQSFDLVGG